MCQKVRKILNGMFNGDYLPRKERQQKTNKKKPKQYILRANAVQWQGKQ